MRHRDLPGRLARLALRFAGSTFVVLTAAPADAGAESWCAQPILAHEWGVHSFASDGAPAKPALPGFFHTTKAPRLPHERPS